MAKVNKDLSPVMRLLSISKSKEINKARDEKILPLLKEYSKEEEDTELDAAMDKLNKAIDAVNAEIENVNVIASKMVGRKQYKVFNTYLHLTKPRLTEQYGYTYGGQNYTLSREQYNKIMVIDQEIAAVVDLKYLTLEAKIVLEGDFKEIYKILKDNSVLVDESIK